MPTRSKFRAAPFTSAIAAEVQDFGDRTSSVNALRSRDLYRQSSMRLLSDLIEVTTRSVQRHTTLKGAPVPNLTIHPPQPKSRAVPAVDGLLKSDYWLVNRAAASSPCLFRSLTLPRRIRARFEDEAPEDHKILLCQRDGLDAPIDALAHLLAAAIAMQFHEAAVAVTMNGSQSTATVWRPGKASPKEITVASYRTLKVELNKLVRAPKDGTRFFHVVVALSTRPDTLRKTFAAPRRAVPKHSAFPLDKHGYDRVVYVTDRLPAQVPPKLLDFLAQSVRRRNPRRNDPGTGPYFCSFIPSIVQTDSSHAMPFATVAVDGELQTPVSQRTEPLGWRLERDRCLIPFDLGEIDSKWTQAGRDGKQRSFAGDLLAKERTDKKRTDKDDIRLVAERWARAVTNRQVGVALSGGGAASFRLVPALQRLHDQNVPIDILSGESGGALIGAYYCHSGRKGLDTATQRPLRFQAMIALAFFHSGIVQYFVDRDLAPGRVEHSAIRFVPLATVLPENGPPESHVVTAGTLGEAVQVSGAAPMVFAPTGKRVGDTPLRFSDGALAALIPARILKDWGADMVLAFNCLPGPQRSNPFEDWPFGRFFYRHTPWGRLMDVWVSLGFLTQRIARETNEDADVYFEPTVQTFFLVDSFLFVCGRRLASQSAQSKNLHDRIAACVKRWETFRYWGKS